MTRLTTACVAVLLLGGVQATAFADPIQVDFNTASFAGPTPGTVQAFTKFNALPGVHFTFQALNQSLDPSGMLYWDANDGQGYADGFGVQGVDGSSYSGDEIEGNERLMVTFSQALNLRGFNLTDFFHEDELTGNNCNVANPYCYIETGSFMVKHADGTFSDWSSFNAFSTSYRQGTNGLFSMDLNMNDIIGIVFSAPGRVQGNYPTGYYQLNDFSLAGLKVEVPMIPTPEPTSMTLLALGLAGLGLKRRRAAAVAAVRVR
jgi:hypothetical protein